MSVTTDTLRGIFRALAALGFLVVGYLGAWALVDVRGYIDVQYVRVEMRNGAPMIDVGRVLHRDFRGGYDVTIRNALTGHTFCSTGFVPFDYVATSKPIKNKPLVWWADHGNCLPRLTSGIGAGPYHMWSCHTVRRPLLILPARRRCVFTEFEVTG